MARTAKASATKAGATSTRTKTKKADLIAQAIQAGVPANRLTGTIPEIQAEVRSYFDAQAQAAVDVADAAFAIRPEAKATKGGGIHPMNGLYIGSAIAAAWHFLS